MNINNKFHHCFTMLLYYSKNRIFLFCFFTIALFSLSCKTTKKLNCDDVQGIKIAYLPKGINTAHAINDCDDILKYTPVVKDTTISDKETIRNFIKLINNLKVSKNHSNEDYRIMCLIIVKDMKNPILICFGEDWLINYNGIIMKDNKKIFKFLDNLLYNY